MCTCTTRAACRRPWQGPEVKFNKFRNSADKVTTPITAFDQKQQWTRPLDHHASWSNQSVTPARKLAVLNLRERADTLEATASGGKDTAAGRVHAG